MNITIALTNFYDFYFACCYDCFCTSDYSPTILPMPLTFSQTKTITLTLTATLITTMV